MKLIIIICFSISLLATSCAHSQDCIDGINKLPLYGNGTVKKCKEQIEDDKRFIAFCEKTSTRKDAAAHMVMRGWQYFYSKNLDTSVMRFNQAWLLDSLNAELYWGLGDILGSQGKFMESLPFFERSLKLDSANPKVLADEANSYGNVFFATKDIKYLNSVIGCLKKAIYLSPNSAQYYASLTGAYSYFMQKDSAKKYMAITDKIDPSTVSPEVRKMVKGE
jgi:tetratricopeptide (TPR) repeat protein